MSETNTSQPILVYPQYPDQNEDQIDLYAIWQQLYAGKFVIIKITTFFAIASIIAALLWPKTWQAEIQFMPPNLGDVQGLNIQTGGNNQYTPELVYNNFLENYQSLSQKRKFFNKNNLLADYDIELDENKTTRTVQVEKIFQEFNQDLKLNLPKKQTPLLFVQSTLDFHQQKASSEHLNQYAEMIKMDVLKRILNEIDNTISLKKTVLQEQIMSKKKIAKNNREDRIAVLNEAIKTARLLNVREGELQFIKGGSANNPINKTTSLYYSGYESLEAEKKVLQERKSDVPFIKGIRELEEKIFQLDEQSERIQSEIKNFSVVTIDQQALVPEFPKKPKRKLMVIISTMLGFILSLFVVFIINIKQKYKKRSEV